MFYLIIACCTFFISELCGSQPLEISENAQGSLRLIKIVKDEFPWVEAPRLKIYTSSSGWSLRSIFFGMPELRLSFENQDGEFLTCKTKKLLQKFQATETLPCSIDVKYGLYQKDHTKESLFSVEFEQTWYNNWVICIDETKYKNEDFYHYAFNGPISYKTVALEVTVLGFLLAAAPCLYFKGQALNDGCISVMHFLIDEFNRLKK
ncbi:hypothetical protein IPH25_02825 [bacterium]|nr:MAG: hypothetical protein IPG37_04965 [bacterium]QQR61400.1 MAG: hypothetical protein IPH25_02825 [bacterium]QQR63078.1 MAG: hypothetical protein IPH67_01210 [bacterium]